MADRVTFVGSVIPAELKGFGSALSALPKKQGVGIAKAIVEGVFGNRLLNCSLPRKL